MVKLFGKKKGGPGEDLVEAERVYRQGVATIKDLISPAAVEITFNFMKIENLHLRTYFVYDYPRYLFTEWLSPIINYDIPMNISLFIYPVDSAKILERLKVTVARMEAVYAEQREKGLVRDPALEAQYRDAEELRDKLQSGEERLFQFGMYFTIFAANLEELEKVSKRLESSLGGTLVLVKSANLQQEEGFNTTLPLGKDDLSVLRNLDTSAISTTFPFVSSELTSNDGILYGLNRHTNGLVIWDRFSLENPNMVIFAKAGAGKSYAVKLEALRSLMMGTEVLIIDPENEYERLAEAVGGAFLSLSVNAPRRINPFDLPVNLDAEDAADALRTNIISLHGLMNLMLGKMNPKEANLMDRALIESYAKKGITSDPATHTYAPPIMSDLHETLSKIEGAAELAEKLRKYTVGSFSGLFNEATNVQLDNPFVVFSIRDLEDELRPIAMYIMMNWIWNRVKSERRKRLLIVDEAWIMMKYEDSAQFMFSVAKRSRKYYLALTTITQDVEDFLSSPYGKAVVTNSSLALLLRQHPAAVDVVVKTFNLTESEKYLLLQAEIGEGLFFAGLNHVALQVISSYNEHMLVTTNPQELLEMQKKQEQAPPEGV